MMPQLVLASASPRRREIVQALDVMVATASSTAPEGPPEPDETAEAYVTRLALAKANEVAVRRTSSLVIGADTVVVLDGAIRGKPVSTDEATEALESLRGRTHRVVTGIAVVDAATGESRTATRSTDVTMRGYTDAEIADYVDRGEPFDKAGAYAVQDRVFKPAERLDGCYLNVVGLPLCDLIELLRQSGVDVMTRAGWRPPEECVGCPFGVTVEASTA